MRPLRVLLMQLPVPNNTVTNVPLAAGYLKAYAHAQGLLEHAEIEILPRALADHAGDAMLVEAIAARAPDVLGMSLYTWNSERSMAIAARAKARLPGLLVLAGGPELQRDNDWLLRHPALDLAVLGEGEQTFAELLDHLVEAGRLGDKQTGRQDAETRFLSPNLLVSIPGLAFRDAGGELVLTPERVALADLAPLPSPYLLGYLDPGQLLMVEISRWCPYACGFCLYGRNMGAKLGSRYFSLERVLAEIAWGRAQGASQVHFVEANLNLVPLFWPLMRALEDLNADGALALYAELRGEHITDAAADALVRAGLRVAEVGLQTANPLALRVAQRRTDLRKWAAGTRRLAERGVEIYLDVILGLPADDAAGVQSTLEFIRDEALGPYDVFTLQVLPGTATRGQAAEYQLRFQDRPPYYILGTDQLSYADLRQLRRELKIGASLDPDAVEGCPPPRPDALDRGAERARSAFDRLWLLDAGVAEWTEAAERLGQLASHVDIVARWDDAARLAELLARAIEQNPSALVDCYLLAEQPPSREDLRAWRAALPFVPGYLDRVAVYRRGAPNPAHERISPRMWLVLPWVAQAEPADYQGAAEIIWAYDLPAGAEPPLGAWAAAGGAGVWARGCPPDALERWRAERGLQLWGG